MVEKLFDQGALFLSPSTRNSIEIPDIFNLVPKLANAMKREDFFIFVCVTSHILRY